MHLNEQKMDTSFFTIWDRKDPGLKEMYQFFQKVYVLNIQISQLKWFSLSEIFICPLQWKLTWLKYKYSNQANPRKLLLFWGV